MFSSNRYFCNKLIDILKPKPHCCVRYYSIKPAVKRDDQEDTIQQSIRDTEKITHIPQKKKPKKPQREPFVKNLLVGRFDVEMLTYPQLEKDELEKLNANLKPVDDYFNRTDVLQTKTLTDDFKQSLNNLSLFGLRTSYVYGGRDLNITETCKFNEIISQHKLKRTLMYNDQFCIQCIQKLGSDKLKNKYLPRLVAGNIISAFCVAESDSVDIEDLKTKAVSSHDGMWVINGTKSWILNGNAADLFIVVAKTDSVRKHDSLESNLVAFVVEKDFGGITVERCATYNDEIDLANITFTNTCVPSENIIAGENLGNLAIAKILTELRLSVGPACTTLGKQLLNQFIDYCKNNSHDKNPLMETDAIKSKVAEIAARIYATESITYLTSNLLDQYDDQDCDIEAAIVKVFSSESCLSSSLMLADFFGTPSYLPNHWVNENYRDALAYVLLNESNDNLKLLIGLMGIQYAGVKLQEIVRQQRNPLFNPAAFIRRMWYQRKQTEDNPTLNLRLSDHLHPSSARAAEMLEYCALRLQFATEIILIRHGASVINAHVDLKRLAECVIDIYAMTASIGRASRSYCIGLRHSEYEMLLAHVFCIKATDRIRNKVRHIVDGSLANGDETDMTIANEVFKWGKYFPEHPLNRNF